MATDPTDDAFRSSPLFQELEQLATAEDWQSLESEARRQHFIPRFLLSRFAQSDGGREFLFQLDVSSGKPTRIAPEQAASRRHFYAVENDEGSRTNRIEGYLARVEGHAAEALERCLDAPTALTPADRATLSFFFALLDARTPGSADRTAVASNSIMRMLLTSELADTEKFAATYREILGDASPEAIEEFRQETLGALEEGRVEFSDPRAHGLGLKFQAAGASASIIFEMRWTLLARPAAFITSDRGLAMYDPNPRFPWSAQAWLFSPYVEVTIPLASDWCLLLDHRDEGRR